jgi:hypothetical protein
MVTFYICVGCGVAVVFVLGHFVGTIHGEDRADAWWRREWERREDRRAAS